MSIARLQVPRNKIAVRVFGAGRGKYIASKANFELTNFAGKPLIFFRLGPEVRKIP